MAAMEPYVVRQGDHLKGIAAARGFDADDVWNDPANAELKALRKTHNCSPADRHLEGPRPGTEVPEPQGRPELAQEHWSSVAIGRCAQRVQTNT
jgi:hypothetical protein